MKKLISVVVPIYNVEKYLEHCIDTIIAQTYKKLEIILVDDGSTDKSSEICDKYAEKDNRIVVIHKENGGLSSARNAGIDVAHGEYIGFVDSDDYIDLKMYEELLNALCDTDAEIAICGRYYVFDDNKVCQRFKNTEENLVMDSVQAIKEMNSFKYFDMAAWDKLYLKSLFDEIRFPVGKLSEDFYIMYKLFGKARKIVYHGKPLYYYLQRQGSISNNTRINFDFAKAAYEQMIFCEKKYPELKETVHIAYASANMTVYNFHLKAKVICTKENIQNFKINVKNNLKYIENSKSISFIKKKQALLFVYARPVYDIMFKIFKKVKRV